MGWGAVVKIPAWLSRLIPRCVRCGVFDLSPGYNARMNPPKPFSAILTLILAAAAGYVHGGAHGALIGCLLAGAAICWRYA